MSPEKFSMFRFTYLPNLLILFVLSVTSAVAYPDDISRYGITQTDDLHVNIRLGGDGIRGGSQLLLVFEMNDGRKRRFDLNRSREEWRGGAEKNIEIHVSPAVEYHNVARIGVEWHGSQGDFTQEQDDFDLAVLHVTSRAVSNTTPSVNGNAVNVFSKTSGVRFDNDQTQWFGGIRPTVAPPNLCSADRDCDDGNYCNGQERCQPSNSSADARGCIVGPSPCMPGQNCNESTQQCITQCVDSDGDGHMSISCGGDDCDDADPNRYPGNVEVRDASDHDEDCDLSTHGIFQGAFSTQICDGPNRVVIVDQRERFERAPCTTGTVCVQQPNGAGICMPAPEGYQAPGAASLPTGPQQAPLNSRGKSGKNIPDILRSSGSAIALPPATESKDKKK